MVIDDGSLTPGGVYAIEDLSTSYYPDWGGADPPPQDSGVGLPDFPEPPQTRRQGVAAVRVYPGIAFVIKAGRA